MKAFLFVLAALFVVGCAKKEVPLPRPWGVHRYEFSMEPIDVVVPCATKDKRTLDLCISALKKQAQGIRRIIVVSKEPLTDQAEWFDEALYPFSKEDIARVIFSDNGAEAKSFLESPKTRAGWILQQLLKLYAPYVIPDISSNVLIVDADVMLMEPVAFRTSVGEPYFNMGTEYHPPYFAHMARLLPGLRRVVQEHSGITHYMLFQRPVLTDLFAHLKMHHGVEPWIALCRSIDPEEVYGSCLSEYEIYFNFIQLRSDQAHLRRQKYIDVPDPRAAIIQYEHQGYSYITSHLYL
ncbi:MAG: hypothetical protein RL235_723 [Chlamydiota bacterium]